jgi:hypothetical protein
VRSGCLSSPNLPQCADAVSLFIISAQSASLRSKAKHLEYILAFTAVSLTRNLARLPLGDRAQASTSVLGIKDGYHWSVCPNPKNLPAAV